MCDPRHPAVRPRLAPLALGPVRAPRRRAPLLLAVAFLGALSALAPASDAGGAPRSLPPESESAQVAAELRTFPGGDKAPLLLVYTRPDGAALTPDDLAAAGKVRSVIGQKVGEGAGARQVPTIPAEDGKAAIDIVPVDAQQNGAALKETVFGVRDAARQAAPGLTVQVTGGPAFGADTANAFAGADVRLLVFTALVVAVLLLVTYRSPVLWLVPLVVVALADRAAQLFAAIVAKPFGYTLDGSTTGILSVLVFGAGTNYALLLVSRYRQELRATADHREALAHAVARSGPAIVASNITVVLALLTLLLGIQPSTRALGVAAASGLVVALLFGLLVLPPALALAGRKLFWPFVPRVGQEQPVERGGWYAVASRVARHPLVTLGVAVPALLLLVLGMQGHRVGLDQTEQFRTQAESVTGYETVKEHFGPGVATPMTVVTDAEDLPRVQRHLESRYGKESVRPLGAPHNGRVALQVSGTQEPGSEAALYQVRGLRDGLARTAGANASVGGPDAQALDTREAATGDRWRIVPAILLVVLVVLLVLLRAVPASLLLIGATTLSAFAAIGAGAWISIHLFGFPAIDTSVVLFAFLFLVALGVDYTIFLISRAQEERAGHGTREGVVRAVSLTGGVITSAGVVLAAVFVVLGVLPLITMTQLGIVVGLGILLDTFVVRTVVIPALFSLVGERVWWPRRAMG